MEWKIQGAIGDIPKETAQMIAFIKNGCGVVLSEK
jgi:hypothetical protein